MPLQMPRPTGTPELLVTGRPTQAMAAVGVVKSRRLTIHGAPDRLTILRCGWATRTSEPAKMIRPHRRRSKMGATLVGSTSLLKNGYRRQASKAPTAGRRPRRKATKRCTRRLTAAQSLSSSSADGLRSSADPSLPHVRGFMAKRLIRL